jgi:predicted RND superfamily exporter protein
MKPRPRSFVPPPWLSAVLLALCGVSIYLALGIRSENNFDAMLEQSSAEAQVYHDFVDQFGNDEFVIVGLSGKPLFSEEALDVMLEALDALEQAPHVAHVDGIPTLYRDRFGAEDPEALEEEMTSTPFYTGLFVSEDHSIGGMMVQIAPSDDPNAHLTLIEGIRTAVKPLEDYGFQVHLVGGPVLNIAISDLAQKEGVRTFATAAVASVFVLLLLLRSFRALITVVACGAVSLALTYGFIGAIQGELNIVTSSLPPILWVLVLANAIHVVCRYQYHRAHADTANEAARLAVGEVWYPCSLSAITTALGFLSLLVAELRPVREFGLYCAFGMVASLIVNLTLAPHLLVLMHTKTLRWADYGDGKYFGRLADAVIRRPYPVILLFTMLLIAGNWSATQLKIEPNPLSLLPQDSETVASYDFVAEELTGLYALEIALETPGGWLNTTYWEVVEGLRQKLLDSGAVARVVSPLDFLKKLNQWDNDIDPAYYRLPESREAAEELVGLLEDEDRTGIRRLVREDGNRIRLSALINTTASNDVLALVSETQAAMTELPAPMSGVVTGLAPRMQGVQIRLINTQMKSFSLSFVMVFLSILIGLRSMLITGVSVLPNVIPILTVFTVMVLGNINLDAATVMVASISMGIAVDDCVHLLAAYRHALQQGHPNRMAIREASQQVGLSITTTTVAAVIGFGSLMQSHFVPIYYFGMLSSVAMIAALAAPLLLVPAVLALRKDKPATASIPPGS